MRRFLRKLSPFSPGFFSLSLPIYTTRKHGPRDESATYSQSLWMTVLAQMIVWANIVLWGGIGIVEAVGRIL